MAVETKLLEKIFKRNFLAAGRWEYRSDDNQEGLVELIASKVHFNKDLDFG